jgi:hypothetical protein
MGIAPGVAVCGFRDDIRVHFFGIFLLLLWTGDEIAKRKSEMEKQSWIAVCWRMSAKTRSYDATKLQVYNHKSLDH